ncbi:hypothetical protein ABIE44_002589 [Marmoricola sp. OAE513]|uniref:hypothetical protein n=1 Tax=Marmoricola sp. OAE513 TaxID=2817894 RepID=UPI001AE595DF
MPEPSLAERLLDAQVAWLVEQLTGPALPDLIAQDVDELLASGSRIPLAALVGPAEVKSLIHLLLDKVPPSSGATTLVAAAADVAYDGPGESYTLADVIDRENVESLVAEVLGMTDLAERFLDQLTESPLVATMASRFVGRIVGDMVQANQAMADKIPGLGSLVSFGTSAAGKVVGAAGDVLGDTAGKGATFAMRRLNKVVVETLRDPTTRDAALEVFDLYADKPVVRLDQLGDREDAQRVAGLLHDIVIAGAPTDPVLALVDALVDGFFATYGEDPVTTLLDDLAITRNDVVAQATAIVPGLLATAHEAGELDRLVRARLEPFFSSPAVAAILGS